MSLSAKEAAALVGLSKQSILKAIHAGKLSATRDPGGAWRIEPVELYRVWPAVAAPTAPTNQVAPVATPAPDEVARLRAEIDSLRRQLADRDQQLADLRRWLDAALAALPPQRQLTGNQAPPDRIPWWRRMFGQNTPK